MAGVFVVAQDGIEPTCPGPCPFGDFDEDRLISDCTAQCNTSFGEPGAAQECVNACSDWQDSISCTATPLVSRRSAQTTRRRRRMWSGAISAPRHLRSDHRGHHVHAEHGTKYNSGLNLERRDMNSCIRSCQSSVHVLSICPGTAAAFISQASV